MTFKPDTTQWMRCPSGGEYGTGALGTWRREKVNQQSFSKRVAPEITLQAGAAALGLGHGVGKMDRGKRCESEWFLQVTARHLTPLQDKV